MANAPSGEREEPNRSPPGLGAKLEWIEAKTALTPTQGYLTGESSVAGFTHSFNPAIGCLYAGSLCGSYCYARGFAERRLGAGGWGSRVLLKANAPELLKTELQRATRRSEDSKHHVRRLAIFSASTTDPCAGPALELYRRCLQVVADFPIRRWVLQTRSPEVLQLRPELEALGSRAVVSFTVESDDLSHLGTDLPFGLGPSLERRRHAAEELYEWAESCGIAVHLAISPCLPLRNLIGFADWVSAHSHRCTVDTFASGDGSKGARTARSKFATWMSERGMVWRDESQAQELYQALRQRMGDRAGWSAEGFLALASQPKK